MFKVQAHQARWVLLPLTGGANRIIALAKTVQNILLPPFWALSMQPSKGIAAAAWDPKNWHLLGLARFQLLLHQTKNLILAYFSLPTYPDPEELWKYLCRGGSSVLSGKIQSLVLGKYNLDKNKLCFCCKQNKTFVSQGNLCFTTYTTNTG